MQEYNLLLLLLHTSLCTHVHTLQLSFIFDVMQPYYCLGCLPPKKESDLLHTNTYTTGTGGQEALSHTRQLAWQLQLRAVWCKQLAIPV